MLLLIFYLFAVCSVIGAALWASITDYRELQIPNTVSLLAIAGFIIAYASSYFGQDAEIYSSLTSHIGAAVIIFVVTAVLFVMKVFGAGDAKMASAYALWIPMVDLPSYLIIMTIVGGLLGLFSLVFRKLKISSSLGSEWVATLQKGGSAVPYGIAIAISFLYIVFENGYLSGVVLKSFLN